MSQHISKKKSKSSKGLLMIKCSCGTKILLVPDVKVMSVVIEAHVAKHIQKIKDPKTAKEESQRIRDHLITQVLDKASKD